MRTRAAIQRMRRRRESCGALLRFRKRPHRRPSTPLPLGGAVVRWPMNAERLECGKAPAAWFLPFRPSSERPIRSDAKLRGLPRPSFHEIDATVRDGKSPLASRVPSLQTLTEARRSREKMARPRAPHLLQSSVLGPNFSPRATRTASRYG